MKLFDQIAITSDTFFNRIGARSIRVRQGDIEILPRPLVTRNGVQGTEDVGGELSGEAVDQWTVLAATVSLIKLFGSNWRDSIQPHVSDWEINEEGQGWRKVRVIGQPEVGEGGRVSFRVGSMGFGLSEPI
jgi:hypothetical protein